MVKRCSWGLCNTDNRYPERVEGVEFVPFPKPKTNLEKCMKWIKLCGRPHSQLNTGRINRTTFICTKHFVNKSWPTPEHPDPLPADQCGIITTPTRKPPMKRKRLASLSPGSSSLINQNNLLDHEEQGEESVHLSQNPPAETSLHVEIQTEARWFEPQDVMSLVIENEQLKQQLASQTLKSHELERSRIAENKNKNETTSKRKFSFRNIAAKAKLFKYCTGFTVEKFNSIFRFLVPDEENCPFSHSGKGGSKAAKVLSLRDQLFMTLCKLRNNWDFIDIGFRFNITQQQAGVLFSAWINFMYLRFGEISTWPHRDIIKSHMPEEFRCEFSDTYAIVDGTEIKTEKPSSLKVQSQTYSDYKSSNTLKSLVVVDPRGSVMFSSILFVGSISDKELFVECGLQEQLRKLIEMGDLLDGDAIMADKGFNIETELKALGLKLNIPPFAHSGFQMSEQNVSTTKKIAKHRVHVERAIRRIKSFKILSGRIPVSLMTNINQIWNVCCFLTNFMPFCIKNM